MEISLKLHLPFNIIELSVIYSCNRMALVDRKVSLPGDFDIQVAYIYPTPIESMGMDMSDDDVSINHSVINIINQIVDMYLILMLPVYNSNIYYYILAESIQQEFSIRRKERQIL